MSFTVNELISSNPMNPAVDILSIDSCVVFDKDDKLLLDSVNDACVIFGSFALPDSVTSRTVDSFSVVEYPSEVFDSTIRPSLNKSSLGCDVLDDLPDTASVLAITVI